NESGRFEIYVRPFPGPGAKVQVSTAGITSGDPMWAPHGQEIYFPGPDRRMMVAEYREDGNMFTVGKPRLWSETHVGVTPLTRNFALSPDGKRFAIIPPREAPTEIGSAHVTFMLNFLDELRRRVK